MGVIKITDLPVATLNELDGSESIVITKEDNTKQLNLATLQTYMTADINQNIDAIEEDLELKVDKVTGKGLSTEDFTSELKTKLDSLNNYSLPIASEEILGAIKINEYMSITETGVLNIDNISWDILTNTPSTILGYNISDAYNKTQIDDKFNTKADLVSPVFIGTPEAPTASAGLSNNQIATTEFVNTEIQNNGSSSNTENKLVRRDEFGDFAAGNITADLNGNANTATNLNSTRTFELTGDVSGSVSSNLSNGFSIITSISDNSHNHTIQNTTGLQDALDSKINLADKAVPMGIATLDTNGKIPLTQLSDGVLGQLEYVGVWDFSTLPEPSKKGQYWIANIAGNGYNVGDWAVWNGTSFDKIDNTDAVSSVAGRTGNVVLTKSDVNLGYVDNIADIDKNVLSATKLTTPRSINGVLFDGTSDVEIMAGSNIISTEYLTGNTRNSLPIFGIEVDLGNLPNTNSKDISFTFNSAYSYWIDDSNSYCYDTNKSYPLNYTGNIGESISCFLDKQNNTIKLLSSDDKSSFIGKLVILYTKA